MAEVERHESAPDALERYEHQAPDDLTREEQLEWMLRKHAADSAMWEETANEAAGERDQLKKHVEELLSAISVHELGALDGRDRNLYAVAEKVRRELGE